MHKILRRLIRLESLVMSDPRDFHARCDQAEVEAGVMLCEPAIAARLATDDQAMDALSEVEARLGKVYEESMAQTAWLRAYLDSKVPA